MMQKLLIQYPSIHNIKRLHINKRWTIIKLINTDTKYDFVKKANTICDKPYRDYFKDKTVAIIGPSPSIYNEQNGDIIEKEYDIIVRVNKQWKHNPTLDKYIGKRTDVLYNCMSYFQESGGVIDSNYLKEHNTKYIIDVFKFGFNDKSQRDDLYHSEYRLNMLVFFHLTNMGVMPLCRIDDSLCTTWDINADTRINTGLMAILDILHMDVKMLYVKGFTFFKDGYINNYRKLTHNQNDLHSANAVNKRLNQENNHDQKKQWLFFKQIIQNSNIRCKLKMDAALEAIMNQYYF